MRNPYIVGRWVRGADHYGRLRLIDHLLQPQAAAIWVISTRRMGKTSLLRQLEWLCTQHGAGLVPLFWDLQGCQTMADLDYELYVSIEDATERFRRLGVEVESLYEQDAIYILRTLQRILQNQGKMLFLLVDEAEAFINVERSHPSGLARLRKIIQGGHQRTIVTSTKQLVQLDEQSRRWSTSPFLFGFSLANLWNLTPETAERLVLQHQNEGTVEAEPHVVEEILANTNGHPYLVQYLCHRLFENAGDDLGRLRRIRDEDLQPDHLLAGFFRIDFANLAPTERQILLTVAKLAVAEEEAIQTNLPENSPSQIQTFLYGMKKLGYLRKIYGHWSVGNEYLRRWILENYDNLTETAKAEISDQSVETLLKAGRQEELAYLQAEYARLQRQLRALLEKRAGYGHQMPWALSMEIQETRDRIASVNRDIQEVTGGT